MYRDVAEWRARLGVGTLSQGDYSAGRSYSKKEYLNWGLKMRSQQFKANNSKGKCFGQRPPGRGVLRILPLTYAFFSLFLQLSDSQCSPFQITCTRVQLKNGSISLASIVLSHFHNIISFIPSLPQQFTLVAKDHH
jgi:hypothetical protein